MAYTPINWQTGDTITADKLNKMDNGWSVESTELFSETVTTADDGSGTYVANLAYSDTINADKITVVFDDTEYTCPSIGTGQYGAPYVDSGFDFSEFPFNLLDDGGVYLTTQTAGEHTVSASVAVLQTSADFDTARGYGYVTGNPTELFSETVTTSAQSDQYNVQLTYYDAIDADTITVTFDGTEYVCPRIDAFGDHYYGGFGEQGPVFTEYPFLLASGGLGNVVYTETAGTHTIAVVASVTSMQASADFSKAVEISNKLPFFISIDTTTWQEAHDAMAAGRMAYTYDPSTNRLCLAVYTTSNTATSTYTITCMTIYSNSSFATAILSAQSPAEPLTK